MSWLLLPVFLSFPPLEKRNWTVLWGGEALVPRREKEGLCVWSLSDHTGQIHQHVCSVGWVEKYEVQREERPLSLQAVSGKGQQDPALLPGFRSPTRWQQLLFLLTPFSSKIVSAHVGQATLKLGMAWLQLGSWACLFSLCCSSSNKRFFCL